MTSEFEKGQQDMLEKIKSKMGGRVVNGKLISVVTEEELDSLEKDINAEKAGREKSFSAKGVY